MMKHRRALRVGTLLLIVFIVSLVWANDALQGKPAPQAQDIPTIDPKLLAQSKTSDALNFLIYFEEQADLSAAYDLSWDERGWYVVETLMRVADASQARVIAYLESQEALYEIFWAENAILVEGSPSTTLNGLLAYREIETLQSIPQVALIEPVAKAYETEPKMAAGTMRNLQHLQADAAWGLGVTGAGIVVGSIDTGVRFTHEALDDRYRGRQMGTLDHNHSWWDAVDGKLEPYDDHGHGSHTTGIMIGTDGAGNPIGMAPDAAWIACKGLPAQGAGSGYDLLVCGQFMLAPWDLSGRNPNPDLRPHVVNNSWGDCGQTYSSWFEGTLNAWAAAGIYPVFANGNAGNCGYASPPGLNTVGNPARSYQVTAVGSTGTDNGQYAPHSNWGPTDNVDPLNPGGYATLKPQVVAPGVGIRSAVSVSDSAYSEWGGTSMSAPHVAGLIALIWEAGPCLTGDFVATEHLLEETATGIPYATNQGDEGPGNVPNHATGWGEINALAAVNGARGFCDLGKVEGVVLEAATQQPIAGAIVEVLPEDDPVNTATTETDDKGFYSLAVKRDEIYALRVGAYGYHPEAIRGVTLLEDGTTTVIDFSLQPNPASVTVRGTVKDGSGHGYPLYAHILIETMGHSEGVFTDPFDGSFEVVVYEDLRYDLTVTSLASGYASLAEEGITFSEPFVTQDYELYVDDNCHAPGYDWVETNSGSMSCAAEEGALMAGFVRVKSTGMPVNGAVITSDSACAISAITPDNPHLPDGFYWLFQSMESPEQTIPFKVSKGMLVGETVITEMQAGMIQRVDFSMKTIWDVLAEVGREIWAVIERYFSELSHYR